MAETETPAAEKTALPAVPARKLALDQVVASGGRGGGVTFLPRTMAECLDFATIMSKSDFAIPPPFRGNPGACLAVTIQACRWEADPFGVIQKAYITTAKGGDQRLAYEAQLVAAVVNTRAGLAGKLRLVYEGEGANRRVQVFGVFAATGEEREIKTPTIGKIKVKNSPLWESDPDQQLAYYGMRAWGRRWCPEVLLGIYTPEEFAEAVVDPSVPMPTRAVTAQAPVDEGIVRAAEPESPVEAADVLAQAEALQPVEEPAVVEEEEPVPLVDNSAQPINEREAGRLDEMRQDATDEGDFRTSAAWETWDAYLQRAVAQLESPDLRTEADLDEYATATKKSLGAIEDLSEDEKDDLRARFVSAFLERKRALGFGRTGRR